MRRITQAIGGAADAARMQNVVNFYKGLPRGSAPAPKARGPIEWYKYRYFSGKGSPARTLHPRPSEENRRDKAEANGRTALLHIITGVLILGYAQNYYFHLRKFCWKNDMLKWRLINWEQATTKTMLTEVCVQWGNVR